jgi:hypothetical protein
MGKIKIERGILQFENNKAVVFSPGHSYQLNIVSLINAEYVADDKLLGVIIENKFNICDEFNLTDGRKYFGFITGNGFDSLAIRFQIISGFDKYVFNPYINNEYELGEEIVISKTEIKEFSREEYYQQHFGKGRR